jgi:FkbM family methyltransferase
MGDPCKKACKLSRGWKVAQSFYEFGARWSGPAFPALRAAARLTVKGLSRVKRFQLPSGHSNNYRYLTGLHEPGTTRVIKEVLKSGMFALDVGAHAGYFTRLFAKLVGPSGRVLAFEPHPASFDVLKNNSKRFRNIALFNCAISDRRMRVSLYESDIHSGRNSLFPDSAENSMREVRDVEAIPLDDIVGDQKVDLVKIDVEGGEIEVLRGAQFLARESSRPVLIIECNPSVLAARGASSSVLFLTLRDMGYQVHTINEDTGGLTPIGDVSGLVEALPEGHKYVNLYCT